MRGTAQGAGSVTLWEGHLEFNKNGTPPGHSGTSSLACCCKRNRLIREVTRRGAKKGKGNFHTLNHGGPRRGTENGSENFNSFLSAEDAEGRGEHQWRIGFSLRDCAALRRSTAICTRKSVFRQTSTSPSNCLIHLPVFGSCFVYKTREMSTNVAPCIRMSRQFSFFLTLFCEFPNRSSRSLMVTERTFCGHFAAFWLTFFAFPSFWASAVDSPFVFLIFHEAGRQGGGSLGTLYHDFGTEIPNLVTNFSRKSITIVLPWSGGADPRFRGGHGLAGILCRRRPGLFDGFGRGTGQVLGPGLTGESVDQAVEGRLKA